MLRAARKRAREQNVPFGISLEDIVIPDVCPALGMKLKFHEKQSQDNSPTLDKIIPKLGYVQGNIAVLSKRANWLKNNASEQEMRQIADWLAKIQGELMAQQGNAEGSLPIPGIPYTPYVPQPRT